VLPGKPPYGSTYSTTPSVVTVRENRTAPRLIKTTGAPGV
jgi:hypothetical protein